MLIIAKEGQFSFFSTQELLPSSTRTASIGSHREGWLYPPKNYLDEPKKSCFWTTAK